MNPLRSFEEFLKEGTIRKQKPDISRANSLMEGAEERREFIRVVLLSMDASMNSSKLAIPFKIATELRLRTGFWSVPIELKAMTKLGKMYMRMKTKKLHEEMDKRAEKVEPEEIKVKV